MGGLTRIGLISAAIAAVAVAGCVGRITDLSEPDPGVDAGPATGQPPQDPGNPGDPPGTPPAQRDCTQPGSCACTSNADCPASFACFAESELRVYCTSGLRGTGALGQPCPNGGRDCASGVCVTPSSGPPVCSIVCAASECAGSALPTCTPLNTTPAARVCL